MGNTANVSLLTRLRASTREQHLRIESLAGMPQTVASHIQTLKLFLGFVEPWELQIIPHLVPVSNQLEGRWKTSLLKKDLSDLGLSDSDITALPQCQHLPSFHCVPAALGSMYVFEGATLGGQIVNRHLEKNLHMKNGIGYSFYHSYGDQVGAMWRTFGELLITSTPPKAEEAVIAAADNTFQLVGDWFESQLGKS